MLLNWKYVMNELKIYYPVYSNFSINTKIIQRKIIFEMDYTEIQK